MKRPVYLLPLGLLWLLTLGVAWYVGAARMLSVMPSLSDCETVSVVANRGPDLERVNDLQHAGYRVVRTDTASTNTVPLVYFTLCK